MNICGTDKDPAGVTCAPGYQSFIASRQAAGLPVPDSTPTTNTSKLPWIIAAAVLAALLARK